MGGEGRNQVYLAKSGDLCLMVVAPICLTALQKGTPVDWVPAAFLYSALLALCNQNGLQ